MFSKMEAGKMMSVAELLRRGFYSMAFQPIYDTASLVPFGFEALLRGPAGTPLANPGKVFGDGCSLADELLFELDMACVGSAVRTGRRLPGKSLIFINIHGGTAPRLAEEAKDLLKLLRDLGVEPSRVVFEVSEGASQESLNETAENLKVFRREGVKVALDDVGSRHPWLHHMLWLEPDFIKLDRTLISGIDTCEKKQALTQGLSFLARQMKSRVVAEGVETRQEMQALRLLDVPLAQGFLLGRPMRADNWRGICGEPEAEAATAPLWLYT